MNFAYINIELRSKPRVGHLCVFEREVELAIVKLL
jgi:hypothetical protein